MIIPVNLANVQAATGFDYPPGKYVLEVVDSKTMANSDGQSHRLVVSCKIVMGPGPSEQYKGRPIANSYQMTEKGAPFLKRLYLAVGITEEFIAQNGGQVDSDWLKDRQFMATLVKNDKYTNVTNEAPLTEWNAGTQSAAPAQTSAPQPSLLQAGGQAPPVMGATQPGPAASAPPPAQPTQGFSAPPPPPAKVG